MPHAPIAPSWLVLPLAMIALLVIAAHITVLREHAQGPREDGQHKMPESRRQIRMVTGWIMMFTVPLLAYAFGIVSPANTESFLASWTAAVALLGLIILMATIDALNNIRLARKQTRQLRSQLRQIFNPTEPAG